MDTLVMLTASAPEKVASAVPQLLTFLSTLLWQALIGGFLYYYRREFGDLLRNLASLKVANAEVIFQRPEPRPKEVPQEVEKRVAEHLASSEPEGFLAPSAVARLLIDAGLASSPDEIGQPLLIFSTSKQHTWLVPFADKLACILDGASTREKGSLIQWVHPKSKARPIVAVPYKPRTGLVSIGPRKNWLYSVRLYPTTSDIESAVEKLL